MSKDSQNIPPNGFTTIWAAMSTERRKELTEKMGSSYMSMQHIVHGRRNISPKRAMKIVDVLNAMGIPAKRHDIRPDLW